MSSQIIGMAGSYFVAGELSHRGYIAFVTTRNIKGIDIVAQNPKNRKTALIEVKSTGKQKYCMLHPKDENPRERNLFYVFVRLSDKRYEIVPSAVVARTIRRDQKDWLSKRGKRGRRHKDTDMRKWHFEDKSKYRDNWRVLRLGKTK